MLKFVDANNKGAEQRIHSLISAFVIRLLQRKISEPALKEILIFKLVSVAEQIGLNMNCSETLKTGFLAMSLMSLIIHVPIVWTRSSDSENSYDNA